MSLSRQGRRPLWPRVLGVCALAGAVAVGAGAGCSGPDEAPPDPAPASVVESLANPVTATFREGVNGYAGTRDISLSENAPTASPGGATTLFTDGDEPAGSGKDASLLLRWDLASIPIGSTLQSVTLTVRVTNATNHAYALQALTREWAEGAATWQRATATTSWEVAGAKGATDRNTTALGSLQASALGTYTVTLNAAGVARVQQWVDAPASNFGFILASTSNTDGLDLASSEAATVTDRPQLAVTYLPPGTVDDPVLLAAGDIGNCNTTQDTATGNLLDGLPGTIALLGDIAYQSGTTTEFNNCFAPAWGRHKARMKPSPGNHEYNTSGATGYYGYFGAQAGDPTKGYYSYDLGDWHIVVLNSNCTAVGGCAAGSAQETWLRQDLAANPRTCTLAYWHHPRFSSGSHGNDSIVQPLWKALDDAGADLILTGHDHNYERWKPQTATGTATANGIVQFVVGTGGTSLRAFTSTQPANSALRNASTWGVLKLTLHPSSYDWEFVPIAGQTFTDKGTGACH